MELIEAGLNDCEVARRTGIPRRTIADWRRQPCVLRAVPELCARCWRPTRAIHLPPDRYAALLGLYLGDGCISESPRTYRLRIALDAKYPGIIDETVELLRLSFPENAVGVVRSGLKGNCVNVSVYSGHLPCLLPQHGHGKKHERRIKLEPWQESLLAQAPWPFIRACIQTDGCAFINRTDVHREAPYEYLSYGFANRSGDIAGLFVAMCDRVGVRARSTFSAKRGLWQVRINRRDSVARMLEHVERKW